MIMTVVVVVMSSDGIFGIGDGLLGDLPQTGCTDTRTRRERTSWSEDALSVVRILLFAESGMRYLHTHGNT